MAPWHLAVMEKLMVELGRETDRQTLCDLQCVLEARGELGKETSRQDSWMEDVVFSSRRAQFAGQREKG